MCVPYFSCLRYIYWWKLTNKLLYSFRCIPKTKQWVFDKENGITYDIWTVKIWFMDSALGLNEVYRHTIFKVNTSYRIRRPLLYPSSRFDGGARVRHFKRLRKHSLTTQATCLREKTAIMRANWHCQLVKAFHNLFNNESTLRVSKRIWIPSLDSSMPHERSKDQIKVRTRFGMNSLFVCRWECFSL